MLQTFLEGTSDIFDCVKGIFDVADIVVKEVSGKNIVENAVEFATAGDATRLDNSSIAKISQLSGKPMNYGFNSGRNGAVL